MIQLKTIGSFTPSATGCFPVRLLPGSEFSPMSWAITKLRLRECGDHLVTVKKPAGFECGRNSRPMLKTGLPSSGRAGSFRSSQVAIGNSVSVLLRRDSSPSRIVFAAKSLALALGFTASLGYAASYKTSLPVEFSTANDAVEHCTILAVRPSTNAAVFALPHVASIEKPGEFGGTLNVINDTLSQTLSQYRAKPLAKAAEGVTTNAWSLTRESGMAVKRHEPPARKGRYSLDYGVTHRSADKEPHDNIFDSDWDLLNIQQSDVISAAEYQWRQIAVNVVASGREQRINSGESRIFSLAKAKMKNAIRTFNNSFSSDLYSDGTATNQINGLQALVADAGTGTVGGINSTNFSFWRNTIFDCSANSVTSSATTIENSMMLPLWLNLDRGPDDQPDLIVMDNTYYKYFEASQTSIKRYMDASNANGGLVSLKYKNADVYFDGNSGIPSSHAYFLNTNYIELVVHRDADMEVLEDQRPINQDGSVIPILWMGNLTLSNRKMQGVIVE